MTTANDVPRPPDGAPKDRTQETGPLDVAAAVCPEVVTHTLDGTPRKGPATTANPLARRDAKGRILPGASLNPGGRKAGLKSLLKQHVDYGKVFEVLASIVYGQLAPQARTADRIKASELLLAYEYGRPQQSIKLDDKAQGPHDVKSMNTDRLRMLASTIKTVLQGPAPDIVDGEIVDEEHDA
jgi:hypothetical protein